MRFTLVSALRPNRYFNDDPPPPPGTDPPPPPPPPAPAKTFSQAEVDRIVQQRLVRDKSEKEALANQLESLKQQGLTPENLDALNARLEALQNEGKTKEQLAAEAQGKLQKKYDADTKKRDEEINTWKSRYETYRSKTEILTSAGAAKAHNAEQVYNILRPDTVMVPEMGEDGKPTGEIIPRVKFHDVDKDGKPTVLDLSVSEAIKRMTEMDRHANLFDSGANSGLGGRNIGRNGGTGSTAIPTDTKSYMEARAKNKGSLLPGTKA